MTNLDSILKSGDITSVTKVCMAKAMVFPVVMYGSQSWTIGKAEHWTTDAFKLCGWRRLLNVPWTARRSNQLRKLTLNIHWKDWCWSWNSNILATWCEELTHLKRPWCWERLNVWGEGDDRGWDGWMALLTQWTWAWVKPGSWWWTGKPGMLQSMGSHRVRHDWLNWTDSLEGLKVKLQYLSHLMWRADSQKTLMLGNIEGREAPVLQPSDVKSWLKRPWCWETLRGGGEGGNRGWDDWIHHRPNGHELEKTQGDSEGQGSLACCSSQGHKESNTT